MATNSLVYSNARAKAMENSLLTQEKITRLVFAENLDEGIRILYESNYGGGIAINSPYDFEVMLQAEIQAISAFLREAMPTGSGLECFLFKNDYHNAKAAMKAKYLRLEEAAFMLKPDGMMSGKKIVDDVKQDNYNDFYEPMQKAAREIDLAFAMGNRSARFIDITLDKALYSHMAAFLKKCKYADMKKYFASETDFKNISALLRTKKLGLDQKFFKEGFLEGGNIRLDEFTAIFDKEIEEIADALRYKDAAKFAAKAVSDVKNEGMVTFEADLDNFLQDIFKKNRNDLFGVAPIAGLFVAKNTEIKVVRMILVCLKNNIDKQIIKKRLREFYA